MIDLPVAYHFDGTRAVVMDRSNRPIAVVWAAPGEDPEAWAKQICVSLNAAHPTFVASRNSPPMPGVVGP